MIKTKRCGFRGLYKGEVSVIAVCVGLSSNCPVILIIVVSPKSNPH